MGRIAVAILAIFGAVAAFAGLAPVAPDAFEPDNTPDEARWIGVDGSDQVHNFHVQGDEDWVRFYSEGEGEIITFETVDLGPNCDTLIELYDDTGENFIESDDNSGQNGGSRFFRAFNTEGFFLLRVVHAQDGFGEDTEYTLRVFREIGAVFPGTLAGVILDSETDAPVPGATIRLPLFGNIVTESDEEGAYIQPALPPDSYVVEASASGYITSSRSVTVQSGVITPEDFLLAPLEPGDVDGNGNINAVDVQLVINAVLGVDIGEFDADVNGDTFIDAVDVQTVINLALGVDTGSGR